MTLSPFNAYARASQAGRLALLLRVRSSNSASARCLVRGGPQTAAKALYFTGNDLEAMYKRAKGLQCLLGASVHDAEGGGIVVRPWGERSFYAQDPWGNPLCFVEDGTVYTGWD